MDTYLALAERVLTHEKRALTALQILRIAYRDGVAPSHLRGRTQHKTLQARLSEDILRYRDGSKFYRTAPGKFFLTALKGHPDVPAGDRMPIVARRRQRSLVRDRALAFKARLVAETSNFEGEVSKDAFVSLTHAEQSQGYREEAEKAYRSSSSNSALRARLEAACKDQGLSLTFKRIALQTGDPDLFTQIAGVNVTNNNQTFQGPVQTGAISNAGTGNSGTISIGQQQQAVSDAEVELKNLLSALQRSPDSAEKASVVEAVEAAVKTPTKSTVGKVVDWLKSAKEGMTSISDISEKAGTFYHTLAPMLQSLPDLIPG